jgi:antitoxin MazE
MYILGIRMLVSKWGNSLAVRLPKALVEELRLREGDEVEIVANTVAGHALRLEIQRKPSVDEVFERVRKFRNRMPANFRFDRDEANSRGRDDAD